MPFKLNPKHVVDFALRPLRATPDARERRQLRVGVVHEHLEPEPMIVRQAEDEDVNGVFFIKLRR